MNPQTEYKSQSSQNFPENPSEKPNIHKYKTYLDVVSQERTQLKVFLYNKNRSFFYIFYKKKIGNNPKHTPGQHKTKHRPTNLKSTIATPTRKSLQKRPNSIIFN